MDGVIHSSTLNNGVMYADPNICAFFTIELYACDTNEVLKSVERGLVFEYPAPSWEQLVGLSIDFLSGIPTVETYNELESADVGSTEKHWVTINHVNDGATVVRIRRNLTVPDSPSRV